MSLSWLQPLYGIDGTAVDQHFKVQGRGTGRGQTDPAHLCACFNRVALFKGGRPEVSVERIAVAAVVEYDQRSKPRKRPRVAYRAPMNGPDRRILRGCDLDPVPNRRTPEP